MTEENKYLYNFQLRLQKYYKLNSANFKTFGLGSISILLFLVAKLVKLTVGMTNLADSQNLFEMIICLSGHALFWVEENLCPTN